MTTSERAVLEALLELDRAVAGLKTANPKPDVRSILERIDRLGAELPADAPGHLRHYLQRKSYEKGEAVPAGAG